MAAAAEPAAAPAGAEPMLPRPWRVSAVAAETADTFTLTLEPADATEAFGFTPGQFNMLYVFGAGEVPISISGDPRDPTRLVHTTRAVGAVTRAMARIKRGDVLGVRGPFGSGWPMAQAEGRDVVLVAGGIGLAPLRAALFHLLGRRERAGRVVLLYGARTPGDLLYRAQLARWAERADLDLRVTVDRGAHGWTGRVGVVTSLIAHAPFEPANALALVCGPEVMMRFAALELECRGVPRERIHLSLERNMACAVGSCGRCQFGPDYLCRSGPVFRYDRVRPLLQIQEL
jgi:NAD(P)H-flavin reductase